jgi:hypothetical protein
MKTAPTKLAEVYSTLKQTVGLALIWVGLNRKNLELLCLF